MLTGWQIDYFLSAKPSSRNCEDKMEKGKPCTPPWVLWQWSGIKCHHWVFKILPWSRYCIQNLFCLQECCTFWLGELLSMHNYVTFGSCVHFICPLMAIFFSYGNPVYGQVPTKIHLFAILHPSVADIATAVTYQTWTSTEVEQKM